MAVWFWFPICYIGFNIIFWVWQVEGVSFFEISGGSDTCEDHILQRTEGAEVSAEPIKLPDFGCLAKDMKPNGAYELIVTNILHRSAQHSDPDGSSSQTDSCLIKVKPNRINFTFF